MKTSFTFPLALLLLSSFLVKAQTPDANGIVYVKPAATGNGSGGSWENATNNLQGAINAVGTKKVFVSQGTYYTPYRSFTMKNGVGIYGGFDPDAGIDDLGDERLIPFSATIGTGTGSVLHGNNQYAVVYNEASESSPMNNTAILDGFTVTGGRINSSPLHGPGITNKNYASPLLTNLHITGNYTLGSGGGIYNYEKSSPLITNSWITSNTVQIGGAGVFNRSSSPVFTNVVIRGNVSFNDMTLHKKTTVENDFSSPTFNNTLIVPTDGQDYTISDAGSNSVFNNSTIIGGVNLNESQATIRNSVFWSIISSTLSSYTAQYSLIQGQNGGTDGNVDATGLDVYNVFVSAGVWGDYRLRSGSPAINKGNNALYPGSANDAKDLAGAPRLYDTTIDIGAYENYLASDANGTVYVKAIATGTGGGNSWADAIGDLQTAIDMPGVKKVFVASGNYDVSSNSFVMKNGVAIYGGFDPDKGIDDLNDLRVMPDATSLQGSVLNGRNERPVIWNVFAPDTPLGNTAVLDGFTLTGGAGASGGGMYNFYASPTLNNLVIRNNRATATGGGMSNEYSSPSLTNVVISGNSIVNITGSSTVYGAGMYNTSSSSPVLTNVTVVANMMQTSFAPTKGAGIYNNDSSPRIYNSIIWNNRKNLNASIAGSDIENEGAVTLVLKNSMTQLYTTGNSTDNNKQGIDPLFVDVGSGNYKLLAGSPAINAGDNAFFTGLGSGTRDLAGNSRLLEGTVDIGAYEYALTQDASGIIYVNTSSLGSGSGSSWANATNDLQAAINKTGVQKVFVSSGNYDVSSESFIMRNGVAVYGGFDPDNGIDDLNDRRIMPNAANSQGSILNGKNQRPVIWNVFTSAAPLDNTAVLDGFTLTGGRGTEGGGMRNVYASPSLSNLVIRNNSASSSGGGMSNENSSPLLTDVVISSNSVLSIKTPSPTLYGGGMYNASSSSPVLTNVTLTANAVYTPDVTGKGAGIYNLNSSPRIHNSIIWNNQKNSNASASGSDIENEGTVGIVLKNSITQLYTTGNAADLNLNKDPLFADAANKNYTPLPGSPAINSGNNDLYIGLSRNTKDLAGNSRLLAGTIDMGAYESVLVPDANGVIYVRSSSFGEGTGSSWADATTDLLAATNIRGVQKVFVASGEYDVSAESLVMKNDLAIYGGFDPDNAIDDLSDIRQFLGNSSLQGSVLNAKNQRYVVSNHFDGARPLNNTAILDGFTLTGGKGDEGGAIHNVYASPTLKNLVIEGNSSGLGGAVCNDNSSPVIVNSKIRGNNGYYGGAILNWRNSSLTATNVEITNNLTHYSGLIYSESGNNIELTNVTIANNTSNRILEGGAVVFKNAIVQGKVGGTYTASYSLIEGNPGGTQNNLDGTAIELSEVFANPAAGDYSLLVSSPAINSGNNALYPLLDITTLDLASKARVYKYQQGGVIDLGAYEYQGDPEVLPVSFGDFTARIEGNHADLQWFTRNEQNNDKFIIYRSANGETFERIGEQQGAGNTVKETRYSFTDFSPLNGINYYRLVQLDRDGKQTELGLKALNLDLPVEVRIVPNPTSDKMNVSFGAGIFSNAELVNVSGKMLQKANIGSAETNKEFSLSNYPAGIYILLLSGNGRLENRKILKY